MIEFENISSIIAASILKEELTETEKQHFDTWLQSSETHRELYDRIKSLHGTQQILSLEKEGYGKKMAERFSREHSALIDKPAKRRVRYIWISGIAASIAFLLMTTIYFYLQPEKKTVQETALISQGYQILPGKTGAKLILANGQSIQLDQSNQNVGKFIDSVYIASNTENGKADANYHTLFIPAGEEFYCQLDDKTSVWLNSETELRFPKKFGTRERKVYLKGEAFFDVKKDTDRPFIVSMKQGNIKVYGTRFNVSNYARSSFETVLVEGSIGFSTPQGREVKIKPSQKLTYEESNGNIDITHVDTSLYTAWVDHMFIFDGQPLEEIMTTLARWYNFKVCFASDDIRHIRLSGQLYRYDDIRVLLDSYEQITGLKFKIENNRIIITKHHLNL